LVLALTIAGFLLLRFVRASASKAAAPTLRTERVRRAVREMYRYIAVKTVTSLATGLLIGGWLWVIDADLPILF
jgi:predicted PurR-regulated permease PerM